MELKEFFKIHKPTKDSTCVSGIELGNNQELSIDYRDLIIIITTRHPKLMNMDIKSKFRFTYNNKGFENKLYDLIKHL